MDSRFSTLEKERETVLLFELRFMFNLRYGISVNRRDGAVFVLRSDFIVADHVFKNVISL